MTRGAASRTQNWAGADPRSRGRHIPVNGIAYGDSRSLAAPPRGQARKTGLVQSGQRASLPQTAGA